MKQTLSPLDSLFFEIILATLAIGLPIVIVLAVRFLWDRHLNLGRSKELDKLVWQLHRIASAMEHQMNLSFPPVQPGTEEARDLAYLQHPAPQAVPQPNPVAPRAAAPAPAKAQPVQPAAPSPAVTQPVAAEPDSLPPLERRDPAVEAPRAGVNSMFGL